MPNYLIETRVSPSFVLPAGAELFISDGREPRPTRVEQVAHLSGRFAAVPIPGGVETPMTTEEAVLLGTLLRGGKVFPKQDKVWLYCLRKDTAYMLNICPHSRFLRSERHRDAIEVWGKTATKLIHYVMDKAPTDKSLAILALQPDAYALHQDLLQTMFTAMSKVCSFDNRRFTWQACPDLMADSLVPAFAKAFEAPMYLATRSKHTTCVGFRLPPYRGKRWVTSGDKLLVPCKITPTSKHVTPAIQKRLGNYGVINNLIKEPA